METYELPILKKNLELIYEALWKYRSEKTRSLTSNEIVSEQKKLMKSVEDAKGDPVKLVELLMNVPESQIRARMESFKRVEADLEILIARIQILRRKVDGEQDTFMVEDLLREL